MRARPYLWLFLPSLAEWRVLAVFGIQSTAVILLNMAFDRMLLPLSGVLTETVAMGASLVLLAILMACYGIAPTAAVLWLPVLVGVTFALSVSIAYPMTVVGLWYPDLRLFVISVARTLFFVAPGLVALDQVPESAQGWLKVNPLTGIFESFRAVLIHGRAPAALLGAARDLRPRDPRRDRRPRRRDLDPPAGPRYRRRGT